MDKELPSAPVRALNLWEGSVVSRKPWWHPDDDDDWDEPLPAVVTLEPEYGAELPLGGEGVLAWQRTKFSPALLDRLAAWQEDFEKGYDYDSGWRSWQARNQWAEQARELEAEVRAELGNRAELVANLWPLNET
jgi:hypothetical protein